MDYIKFESPMEVINYIKDLNPDYKFSIKFKQIGLRETEWYPLISKLSIQDSFIRFSSEHYDNTLRFNYKILEYMIVRVYAEYIKKKDKMLIVDKEYHIPLFSEEYFKELVPEKIDD